MKQLSVDFLISMYMAEKAKRMKADPDNARLSPAMRNLEACANLKDEQV